MLESLVARAVALTDRGAQHPGIDQAVEQALMQAAAQDNLAAAVRVHAVMSLTMYRRNQFDAAIHHAATAMSLGDASGDPAVQAEGWMTWARIDWVVGDLDEALRYLEQALQPAKTRADDRVQLHVYNLLGLVHADLGQLDQSIAFHEQAWQAALRAGVPDLQMVACTNLGGRWLAIGNRHAEHGQMDEAKLAWQRVIEVYRDAEALCVKHDLMHTIPHLLVAYAATLGKLGRFDDALREFARQRRLAEETGDRTSMPHGLLSLAQMHMQRGELAQAKHALRDGLNEAKAIGRTRTAPLHLLASEIAELEGDYAGALRHFKQYHQLREQSAIDRAHRKSAALAVRLETEQAIAQAEAERQKARALIDINEELQATAERLKHEAHIDPLTGIANRRLLDAQLLRMHTLARAADKPLYVALLDVDHFKKVNDTYSHATGDAVLREVGMILKQHCRESDLAARYGGEEFVIALPETGLMGATAFAERIRELIEAHPFQHAGGSVLRLTASVGVATYPSPGLDTVEDLLATADQALYRAKAEGRNRVRT